MPPESDDAIARVPEDPIATGLFHGFYSLAHDLGLDSDSVEGLRLADWSTQQIFSGLIRLVESTGSIRLWNPEGIHPAPSGGARRPSSRRCWPPSMRESAFGRIFPNPFLAS
jgi:hypothetical protein